MFQAGYINGAFIAGTGIELVVDNPSDQSVVATFPGLAPDQTAAAIAAARDAFDRGGWADWTMAERAVVLRRYCDELDRLRDRMAAMILAETGCPPHSGGFNAQVPGPMLMARECIEFFLSLPEIEENPLPMDYRVNAFGQAVQSVRRYDPIGVVAGIAAYNYPFYTAMWKVFPALLAGNTIVLRPNPLTPLSAVVMAEAADKAGFPKGAFNLVIEKGPEGAQLMSTDPRVDMVAFTGSSPVGALVMAQGAPTFKRLQLELGGKSAQIFLPDSADRAVQAAATVPMGHAGQGCAHGTRIFVPEDRKAEIVAKAAELVSSLRVGHSDDPTTQVGPVISEAQVQRCEHFVREAVAHGGRVAAGGKRPAHLTKGYFFEPTLLDLPDNKNPAAQEEIFGPVAAIIGYRDLDHAIAMANDSPYALSGYVFGQDKKAALAVAMKVRSGTVHVNGAISSTYASFGGHKASGVGRERGVEGMRLYQQMTCMTLA